MAAYELKVAAAADRVLARIPEFAAAAIVELITGPLLENPLRLSKELEQDLAGYRVAKRGPYRVVFRIEHDAIIRVTRIDHRADVYRTR
ncbi:MAG: type II toxin-antitoxin system RelE/ParE family toxin [Coriobacteriia bacterium]|nr:type II toxin-antitoxin system RelE/ParE family toxin [Coriobacteriia bacterium]